MQLQIVQGVQNFGVEVAKISSLWIGSESRTAGRSLPDETERIWSKSTKETHTNLIQSAAQSFLAVALLLDNLKQANINCRISIRKEGIS
jgi:hypothetical protein